MALGVYHGTVFTGDPLTPAGGATIRVRKESDGTLVAVYEDRDGNSSLGNPFQADSSGRFTFYADPIVEGLSVQVTSGGASYTLNNVQPIGDPSPLEIGTEVGDVVALEDIGGGEPGLPEVDGSQLTGLAQSQVSGTRELLTGNTNLYVNTSTGNDTTGNGSSGTPWATIAKAVSHIYENLDVAGFTVIINVTGSVTEAVNVSGRIPGGGIIRTSGNTGSPISWANAGTCLYVGNGANVQVEGFAFNSTSASCIYARDPSTKVQMMSGLTFQGGDWQVRAGGKAYIEISNSYSIVGGASGGHYLFQGDSLLEGAGFTATLTGTPGFSVFALFQQGSVAVLYSDTFSGAATGSRHSITGNSVVDSFGGSAASYFPGNSAGSTGTGGQFL